jgi:hypothetical protein
MVRRWREYRPVCRSSAPGSNTGRPGRCERKFALTTNVSNGITGEVTLAEVSAVSTQVEAWLHDVLLAASRRWTTIETCNVRVMLGSARQLRTARFAKEVS